jgi:hypothetical protein
MATPVNNPSLTQQPLYDTDMGDVSLDISANNRKFQRSIVVKQDPAKNGVLSFLKDFEESIPSRPTEQPPNTMRPSRRQGGY